MRRAAFFLACAALGLAGASLAGCAAAPDSHPPAGGGPLRPTSMPVLPPEWAGPGATAPPPGTAAVTAAPVATEAPPEPIPPPSPPPHVARGTGTPSDKALAEGDAAFAKADYAAAEKAYQSAAKLAPKDPAPLVGLVRARLGKAGVPEGLNAARDDKTATAAVVELKKAVRLDATYGPAQVELARTLLALGLADEALPIAQKAAEISPTDPEAHAALGLAYLATTGDVDKALPALKRSADLAPGDFGRQLNLATVLLSAARPKESEPVFAKALRILPDDPRAENGLGTALLWLGEVEKAQPHIEKAVKADPENASYKQNLGYSWSLRGDWPKAIDLYQKALEKNPKLASAWINLGNAYANQDKFKDACDAYAKVHALDPTDPRLKTALLEVDEIAKKKGLPGAGCKVTPAK